MKLLNGNTTTLANSTTLANATTLSTGTTLAAPTKLAAQGSHNLSQLRGLEKAGITEDFLNSNTNFYDIGGKVMQENAFLKSATNAPSIDSMLDDSENISSFS